MRKRKIAGNTLPPISRPRKLVEIDPETGKSPVLEPKAPTVEIPVAVVEVAPQLPEVIAETAPALFHPLTREAMNWYNSKGVLGDEFTFSPFNFLPLYVMRDISFLLGRSLELEEVKLLIQRESDETFQCICGCNRVVVPIRWVRPMKITNKCIQGLKGRSLLEIADQFVYDGVFEIDQGKLIPFAGVAFRFDREERDLRKSAYIPDTCLGYQYHNHRWPMSLASARRIIEQEKGLKSQPARRDHSTRVVKYEKMERSRPATAPIKKNSGPKSPADLERELGPATLEGFDGAASLEEVFPN